jgi:hypothetical protein
VASSTGLVIGSPGVDNPGSIGVGVSGNTENNLDSVRNREANANTHFTGSSSDGSGSENSVDVSNDEDDGGVDKNAEMQKEKIKDGDSSHPMSHTSDSMGLASSFPNNQGINQHDGSNLWGVGVNSSNPSSSPLNSGFNQLGLFNNLANPLASFGYGFNQLGGGMNQCPAGFNQLTSLSPQNFMGTQPGFLGTRWVFQELCRVRLGHL